MRETFHVRICGEGAGNRCLYPEADAFQPTLVPRFGFQARLSASVRLLKCIVCTA